MSTIEKTETRQQPTAVSEAVDRLVALSIIHAAASKAARAAPLDARLLNAWGASLADVEAASLDLAKLQRKAA